MFYQRSNDPSAGQKRFLAKQSRATQNRDRDSITECLFQPLVMLMRFQGVAGSMRNMTFISHINRPGDQEAASHGIPDLERRIDSLLQIRLSKFRMPEDIKPLFDRRIRNSVRKTTAAWCFWVGFLVLLNGIFDYYVAPTPLVPTLLAFRVVIAATLGLAGWAFERDLLLRVAPAYIGLPCVLAVVFAGIGGLLAHDPTLLARYMDNALIVVASSIMFVGLDMRFNFGLAAICVPLIAFFLNISGLHPFGAQMQVWFFDCCTIALLIYGRHMQNLVLARMFLLNMRDDLRNSNARARNDQLSSIAYTDPLTEIPNRRYFEEICASMSGATKNLLPLSLCMIDIDHFKLLNDKLGHLQGDRCLKLVAATIRNNLRGPADIVARFGGEEFVILLPATSLVTAADIAERVRAAIMALDHTNPGSPLGVVTISTGVAEITSSPVNMTPLLQNADHALYRAKISGRNRVCT
jgi:diguanylate cyclase (GGDEF)-like protein